MPKFPVLGVLEHLKARWGRSDRHVLSSAWMVCCQHLLETTGSLIEALVDLGLRPERVFVLGKVYSTHAQTAAALKASGCHVIPGSWPEMIGGFERTITQDAKELWGNAFDAGLGNDDARIIVLDDGGHCTRQVPSSVVRSGRCVVVEQTTSGLASERGIRQAGYPVIAVAASAAKRILESPMIANAILGSLERRQLLTARLGVLGYGALGKAMTECLSDRGLSVRVYDKNLASTEKCRDGIACSSQEQLLSKCDLVIGCTGQSSVRPESLFGIRRPVVLASGSSGDVEFQEVLTSGTVMRIEVGNCPDVVLSMGRRFPETRILRYGFPVNFDNTFESVPRYQIQLTRGLLLGGVLQAVRLGSEGNAESGAISLSAELQQEVVECWLACCEDNKRRLMWPSDLRWIKANS